MRLAARIVAAGASTEVITLISPKGLGMLGRRKNQSKEALILMALLEGVTYVELEDFCLVYDTGVEGFGKAEGHHPKGTRHPAY